MPALAQSLIELIGDTPLVRIQHCYAAPQPSLAAGVTVWAKIESRNPGGSVKDRIALAMIEDAEASGRLKPGGTIIEPTSGNTGIGLAWIGALRGYRVILTMPESMSVERRKLLKAYGAQIVLTPATEGMKGAVAKAERLLEAIPGSIMPGQFSNPANPAVHERTTGPEIWAATGGRVDILVGGVGTGGTLSGAGRYLKRQNPTVKVVAVEPESSQVLAGKPSGSHLIQGIGAGFVPGTYDPGVVDEILPVDSHAAIAMGKALARRDGILGGISSGAAVLAAGLLGSRPGQAGSTIVTILPDTGERYISTLLFYED